MRPALLASALLMCTSASAVTLRTALPSVGLSGTSFQANSSFIMNVYRCVSRERIEQYLNPLIHSLILGMIEEKSIDMAVNG